ncbi:MAG: hypothetical protein KDA99_14015, partial [Planctomycetales bacterium]|nr:hypothetical protein [Planctomycetales bacterium]
MKINILHHIRKRFGRSLKTTRRLFKSPGSTAAAAVIAGGLMFAGSVPSSSGAELIGNGSFEENDGFNGNNVGFDWLNDTGPRNFNVYNYSSQVYYEGPAPAGAGDWYFHSVGVPNPGGVYQRYDLTQVAPAETIDAGTVGFDFSAWLAGYTAQNDHPRLELEFQDDSGTRIGRPIIFDGAEFGPDTYFIGTASGDPVETAANPLAVWKNYQATGGIFVGARTAQLTIFQDSISGNGNDNYVDLLSLDVADTGVPQFLAIEVNTTTGAVKILNQTTDDVSLNFYQLVSEGDSLSPSGWSSFHDQSLDSLGGTPEQNWTEGGGSDSSELVEAFLLGTSSVDVGETLDMGKAYDASVDARDVRFYYGLPNGSLLRGIVTYVEGGTLVGDYNQNGVVDAADYTIWKDAFGQNVAVGSSADGNNNGVIDAADYTVWKDNFGNSLANVTAETVPEPNAAWLGLLATVYLVVRGIRRRVPQKPTIFANSVTMTGVLLLILGTNAHSTTLDRDYQLGDNPDEAGIPGQPAGKPFGGLLFTFDGAGQLGNNELHDLQVLNEPTYVATSDRPLASANSVGITLDGINDYLLAPNLNLPSTSIASIGYDDSPDGVNIAGPLNYNNITDRSLAFWVKPAGSSQNRTQSIVMDSNQHGVRIVDGKWSMRYAGIDQNSDIDVAFDAWSHVMLVRPRGAEGGSILYVDGIAVAARPGDYGGAHEELVVGSNTSRDETRTFTGGTDEFFSGIIDDLTLSVIGDNSSVGGTNYGVFNLATDNQYIASIALAGTSIADVNMDGSVNGDGTGAVTSDDVSAFVAGWRHENLVNGVRAGDLSTRSLGDLNMDGITNLQDWTILNVA